MPIIINIPLPDPDAIQYKTEKEVESVPKTYEVEVRGTNADFHFSYARMYEAPPLGYKQLRALVEYFGTEKIDTSSFANSGCETCDHGSSYGFDVMIEGATRNLPFPTEAKP